MNLSAHPSNVRRTIFTSASGKEKKSTESNNFFPNKRPWQWYEPQQKSAPVRFFRDTSLHGLQYLGQEKRHFCERIFWMTAFTAALIASTVLIWDLWDGYVCTPIVTVFNPTEKSLAQIPFPAVTICNVNNVKKSYWEKYKRDAELSLFGGLSNETVLKRYAAVDDIYQICHSAKTFVGKFKNHTLHRDVFKETVDTRRNQYQHFQDPIETLRKTSQSCKEMILFCLWLGNVTDCSEIFQEIETDFGICCTFNMIPVSLLKRNMNNTRDDVNTVKEWEKLNITYDNLVLEDNQKERKYPYRQLYTGRSAGLSFLADPELEEYHCTNTDSEGFVVALHLPLDFPRIRDNGNAVRTNSEVFIGVRPEITMPAKSAKTFKKEIRKCYFDGERILDHYTKYTASNCLDECIAETTLAECQCLRYYMPRNGSANNELLCKPEKYSCTDNVRDKIIRGELDQECSCWPSCSEILYHSEATTLHIRQKHIDELFDSYPNMTKARNASIIHVYFNVDSLYPRLIKEKSTVIELISNAGGLLGLCMGFSMLSLLEILYHVTIRAYCNAVRERFEKEQARKIQEASRVSSFDEASDIKSEINQCRDVKNFGFLSKMLNHHGDLVRNFESPDNHQSYADEIFYKTGSRDSQDSGYSPYFRTPFEADFQRAYYATTWLPQKMS